MSKDGDDWRARAGRRRRFLSLRTRQVPIRALIPNMLTLLGLCASLTAIRFAIESRFPEAIALIVIAAAIDGIDGRMARLLKAQSRFGAELDSLADFVNFGVAPAILIFAWALGGQRSFGWIVVMIYAVACGLRLARFNAALDVEKPRWQSNYFTGVPAPAAAGTVMLPLYIYYVDPSGLGGFDIRSWPVLIMAHTLVIAFLMISTIPTFSGKLAGEKIGRDLVPLTFMGVALGAALLFTYPYATLAVWALLYLAVIPLSVRRFRWHKDQDAVEAVRIQAAVEPAPGQAGVGALESQPPATAPPGTPETRH